MSCDAIAWDQGFYGNLALTSLSDGQPTLPQLRDALPLSEGFKVQDELGLEVLA